jgi:transketolase C-terminal domain/subunit
VATPRPAQETLGHLAELGRGLLAAGAGPVAWSGPAGSFFYRLRGGEPGALEAIAQGSGSEEELLGLALGWRAAQGAGPLTVVVEQLSPGLLAGLARAARRDEDLLVILVDPGRRYSSQRASGVLLGRRPSRADTPAHYLETLGVHYLGPLELDRAERLQRDLASALGRQGTRLLHLVGPAAEVDGPPDPDPSPQSGEFTAVTTAFVSGRPARPGTAAEAAARRLRTPGPAEPAPIQTRRARRPEGLESAALTRLAVDLAADPEVVCFWARSAGPGPLKLLGERLIVRELPEVMLAAAGAAAAGRFPVLAVSARGLPRLLGPLMTGVGFPITLLVLGGGSGSGSPPHPAALHDLALLRALPSATIAVPADEEEFRGMMAALRRHPGLGVVRLTSSPAVGVEGDGPPHPLPPGRGRLLRRGRQLSLVTVGSTVFPAVLASELLHSWGLEVGVYDMRYLQPLDRDLLAQAAEAGAILTVEDHAPRGGLGTALLEEMARAGQASVPVRTLGVGRGGAGLESCGLDAQGIAAAALEFLGYPRPAR